MPERPAPASLVWLAGLLLVAILTAAIGGGVLYVQAIRLKRVHASVMTRGDIKAGRATIARYGCGACHVIAGIADGNGGVGPDLTHIGQRAEIADTLPNDPDAMIRWLMHPQAIVPQGGMPDQGVTDRDARDMAAFLYAQ